MEEGQKERRKTGESDRKDEGRGKEEDKRKVPAPQLMGLADYGDSDEDDELLTNNAMLNW